jgi:ABC-type dipeptide/oligopeptide/nickel transport system permease subunit
MEVDQLPIRILRFSLFFLKFFSEGGKVTAMATAQQTKVKGYLPPDMPSWGAMISLGFQQVLTMFPRQSWSQS